MKTKISKIGFFSFFDYFIISLTKFFKLGVKCSRNIDIRAVLSLLLFRPN